MMDDLEQNLLFRYIAGLTYARKKKSLGINRGSFILTTCQFYFHTFGFKQRFN